MSSRPEIPSVLREYRMREEQLLFQLERAIAVDPAGTKITRGLMGELGAVAGDELFGLRTLGRQVGKALVDGQQKQSGEAAIQQIALQHQGVVSAALGFAKTTSTVHLPSRSNTQKMIAKLVKAQNHFMLTTRIRKTIAVLLELETADLAYADTLPAIPEAITRFPRVAALRGTLPESEAHLRKFLRRTMVETLGPSWMDKLREKFPREYPRWRQSSLRRAGTDPLDGQTFGELVLTLDSFPEVRKGFAEKTEYRLAIGIVRSARPTLMQPLETLRTDVDESEFRKIQLAIQTIIGLTTEK